MSTDGQQGESSAQQAFNTVTGLVGELTVKGQQTVGAAYSAGCDTLQSATAYGKDAISGVTDFTKTKVQSGKAAVTGVTEYTKTKVQEYSATGQEALSGVTDYTKTKVGVLASSTSEAVRAASERGKQTVGQVLQANTVQTATAGVQGVLEGTKAYLGLQQQQEAAAEGEAPEGEAAEGEAARRAAGQLADTLDQLQETAEGESQEKGEETGRLLSAARGLTATLQRSLGAALSGLPAPVSDRLTATSALLAATAANLAKVRSLADVREESKNVLGQLRNVCHVIITGQPPAVASGEDEEGPEAEKDTAEEKEEMKESASEEYTTCSESSVQKIS